MTTVVVQRTPAPRLVERDSGPARVTVQRTPAPRVVDLHRPGLTVDGAEAGDLAYYDGSRWQPLHQGIAGQGLVTPGDDTAPVWTYGAAGALEYFVDPATGSDSAGGLTSGTPLATHTEALARLWARRPRGGGIVTLLSTLALGANPRLCTPQSGLTCGPVVLQGTWVDSGLGTLTATGGNAGTSSPYVPATITTTGTLGAANAWQHRRVRCIMGANAGKSYFIGSHTATGSPGTITLEHVLSSAFANTDTFVIEVQTSVTYTGTLTIYSPHTAVLRALSLEGDRINHLSGKLGATGCRFKSAGTLRLISRAGAQFIGGGPDFYELCPTSVVAEDNGDAVNAMGNGFAGTSNSGILNSSSNAVQLHWGSDFVDPFMAANGGRLDCTRCTFDAAITGSRFISTFKGEHTETSCRWIGTHLTNPVIQADNDSAVTLSAVSFAGPNGTAVSCLSRSHATIGGVTGTTVNANAAVFAADAASHLQINLLTCTINNTGNAAKYLKLDGDAERSAADLSGATYLGSAAGGSTAKNGA